MGKQEQESRPCLCKRLLAKFGIRFPTRSWFPVTVTKRFGWTVVVLVALFVLGSGGFVYYSSKPEFCKSCHILRPYYDSWKASAHGKAGVSCLKCHFAPGFASVVKSKLRATKELVSYVTQTYDTNFTAEIPDASCLRSGCHERRLLEGKVDFKGISFDHKHHLTELRRGKKLRCQTCHSQIVQGAHVTVTESVCFTCHFKDLKHGRVEEPVAGCTGCHEVPGEPIELVTGSEYNHRDYVDRKDVKCVMCHFNTVQGTGHVPRQVCISCHSEPERIARYDEHEFIHQKHVTDHKVECFHCHSEILHGKNPKLEHESEATCARCHSGKHDLTAALYRGEGGLGVDKEPSAMWAASVQCIACHKFPSEGKAHPAGSTYTAGEQSCVACHGDMMEGMLESWREEAGSLTSTAEKAMQQAREAMDRIQSSAAKKKANKLYAEAERNYDLVKYGKAIHNMSYATSLVERVSETAEAIGKMAAEE